MGVWSIQPFTPKNNSSIEEVVRTVKKWPSVCLDTETDSSGNVIMLQLGTDKIQFVIDARVNDITTVLSLLKNKLVIAHNVQFDYRVLLPYVKLNKVADTMIEAQILECGKNAPKGYFTLEQTVRRYVDPYAYSNQLYLWRSYVTKSVRDTFASHVLEFTDEQIEYGALDVYYTYLLHQTLWTKIVENKMEGLAELENEFALVLADMSHNGIKVNVDMWLELAKNSSEKVNALENELNIMAGKVINWKSPKQVLEVFKPRGIDAKVVDKETGELKDTVGRVALMDLKISDPLLDMYIKYREEVKKSTSYGEKFLRHLNPATGKIHTSFFQIKSTGRTGSGNPNMQNIPRDKDYRSCFQAEDGNVFVIADFSNQELRVLADKANEPKMLDAFKNNIDIHLQTARIAFNNPNLQKDSNERQMAKSINFLMAYGGGASKLAKNFNIPIREAKALIKKYFAEFSKLESYFKTVGSNSKEKGYIQIDNVVNRISHIPEWEEYKKLKDHIRKNTSLGLDIRPEIESRYSYLDSKIQRDSQNYPIQGDAANVSKYAGVLLRRKADKFKLIMLIHDEWMLECKEEDAQEVSKILEECMLEASKKFCSIIDIPAQSHVTTIWTK